MSKKIDEAKTVEELTELIKNANPQVSRHEINTALSKTEDQEMSLEELEHVAGGIIFPPVGNN